MTTNEVIEWLQIGMKGFYALVGFLLPLVVFILVARTISAILILILRGTKHKKER